MLQSIQYLQLTYYFGVPSSRPNVKIFEERVHLPKTVNCSKFIGRPWNHENVIFFAKKRSFDGHFSEAAEKGFGMFMEVFFDG